ncbi:unnamed protein product [Protopolystoma xenopodis]|uniref:Uncharacterized protein n=1 Tax=Protopolystoma xenopodis TaxID=117903 RepID=A0A3S5AES4_9PLAT|nr:unnamed protein product [Protopolystoma xenopodis]
MTTAVSSRTGKISTGSNSACQESPPDRIVASYAAAAHAVALAKQQPLSNAAEAFLSSVSPSGAGSSSSNSSVSRSGKTNGGGSRRYAYSNNPQLHSRPNLATTVKVSSTTSCSSRTPGINSKAVSPQTPGLTGAILTTSSSTIEPNKMTACANSKARCGWSRIVDRLAASVTYIS